MARFKSKSLMDLVRAHVAAGGTDVCEVSIFGELYVVYDVWHI